MFRPVSLSFIFITYGLINSAVAGSRCWLSLVARHLLSESLLAGPLRRMLVLPALENAGLAFVRQPGSADIQPYAIFLGRRYCASFGGLLACDADPFWPVSPLP